MQDRWLKCRLAQGMFSNEFTVTVKTASVPSDVSSYFVSDGYVHADGRAPDGRVLVRAYRDGSTWWAMLPTDSLDIIPVAADDLQPS
jgi:hypothetical protein